MGWVIIVLLKSVLIEDGIFFKMLFLFRLGHPPIFILWYAILTITEEQKPKDNPIKFFFKSFFQGTYFEIKLKEFPKLSFKILKSTFNSSSIPHFIYKLDKVDNNFNL